MKIKKWVENAWVRILETRSQGQYFKVIEQETLHKAEHSMRYIRDTIGQAIGPWGKLYLSSM